MPQKNIYVKDIYGPKKKKKKRLIISLCFTGILVTLIVILAYFGQNVGSFSIKLGDDLTSRQIFISEKEDFSWYDSRLEAASVKDAAPISYIPWVKNNENNFKKTDGAMIACDNSIISYTFYLKNMGREIVNVMQQCSITGKNDGLELVTWLEYFEDDNEGIVYQGGNVPDKASDPFFERYPDPKLYDLENNIAYENKFYDLHPGDVKKFTLITWVDSQDPDLSEEILGGTIRFEIYFSLFRRW